VLLVRIRLCHESGVSVRVTWIGMGGFVFFGAFEGARKMLEKYTSLRIKEADIDL
jgi:hypothetical protein